jgi:hypothetical protein
VQLRWSTISRSLTYIPGATPIRPAVDDDGRRPGRERLTVQERVQFNDRCGGRCTTLSR